MACWKAHVEFLLSVIELLFLSLTNEALQGKRCHDSLLSGGVDQFERRFQGKGSSLGNIFLVSTKPDRFCCLAVQTAPCYVPSFWYNTGVWRTGGRTDRRTDMQTDGNAIASTALALQALRRCKNRWLLPNAKGNTHFSNLNSCTK